MRVVQLGVESQTRAWGWSGTQEEARGAVANGLAFCPMSSQAHHLPIMQPMSP